MIQKIKSLIPHGIAVFISIIFLSSLPYKFTGAPETMTIFGKLDAWAASFGFPGLFATSGLFGPYAIGSLELLASLLLIAGIVPLWRVLQGYGALLAGILMTGAVTFHLFTPLGIDPNNDGGGLFMMAVLSMAGALVLVYLHRRRLLRL